MSATTEQSRSAAIGESGDHLSAPLEKETEVSSQAPSTVLEPATNAQDEPSEKAAPPAEGSSSRPEPPQRGKAKVALIMTALCMAVFLAAIDITIITTALPTISEHFRSSAGFTWIGSGYLLAASSSTPIWGKVSDVFGRKPILLLANFTFFVGSLIAGAAVNIDMVIAGRVIQGIGGGGLVTLVNICIGDLFSPRSRGAYYGMIGGVWAVASSLGPIVGGAFTEKVTWRWCFYINLPLDGAAFLIILFFLDLHTPRTPLWEGLKAIDWIGAISVVGATLMVLLGLQLGGVTHPWKSAIILCLIIFGIFTFVLFFLNEWKLATYPIMPLRLFKKRSNIAVLTVCFVHGMVFVSVSYFMPVYFQAILGATPLLSGVYLLPSAVAISFASMSTGIFIRKTGLYQPPIWTGMFFLTVGMGLFINLDPHSSWAKIILYQIIAGIGVGPIFQAPLIAIQSMVSPRDIASVTATFGFIRNLATAISVVVGSVVFQNQVQARAARLVAALGPQAASHLNGASADANVLLIKTLPPGPRAVARSVFSDALKRMWIVYVAITAVGLVASLFIVKNVLSKQHEETKTGLEGERERKREADEEKRRRKESRDLEAARKKGEAEAAA